VVEPYPFQKMMEFVSWMLGSLFPTEWKVIKTCSKPPTSNFIENMTILRWIRGSTTDSWPFLVGQWATRSTPSGGSGPWALNWKNAPHLGCGTCQKGTSWKVYFPDLDVIPCNILSTRLKVVHGWLFCYNGSSNLFSLVSFRPCWEVKQTFETYCGWCRFDAWIETIIPLPETEITPGS